MVKLKEENQVVAERSTSLYSSKLPFKQLKKKENSWKDLNADEKGQIKEAKVNFQGRIITFETFACDIEEVYEALSPSEIRTLLNGKQL